MKIVIKRLKAELKELAETIRTNRPKFKDDQRAGVDLWKSEAARAMGSAQHEFRHKHIVRCLLRGRTMEQIETLPKEGRCPKETCSCCNKPNQKYINQLMEEYKNEALSRDAGGSEQGTASSAELPRSGDVVHGAPAPLVGAERNDSLPEGSVSERSGEAPSFLARVLGAVGLSRA